MFPAGMYSPHDNLSAVPRYRFIYIVYSRADLKYLLRYYTLISVLLLVFPEV